MAKNDDPRAAAIKAVDQRLADKEASVAEYYRKQDGLQPTPTQRENDLARVGALDIDDKEDDGSDWDTNTLASDANQEDPYKVRDLQSGGEGGDYKRKAGRPRKSEG